MRTRTMSVLFAVAVLAGMGVSCTMPPGGSAVLALAYINLDGQDGYDPHADVLIAQFEDTDKSGDPTVGDTVRTNQYPLNLMPAGPADFGDFLTKEYSIAGIVVAAEQLTASTATGQYAWVLAAQLEGYGEDTFGTGPGTFFNDWRQPGGLDDVIGTNPASPSQPQQPAAATATAPADDPFIDVDFFFTAP